MLVGLQWVINTDASCFDENNQWSTTCLQYNIYDLHISQFTIVMIIIPMSGELPDELGNLDLIEINVFKRLIRRNNPLHFQHINHGDDGSFTESLHGESFFDNRTFTSQSQRALSRNKSAQWWNPKLYSQCYQPHNHILGCQQFCRHSAWFQQLKTFTMSSHWREQLNWIFVIIHEL